jgi:hypothetical protein
MEKEFVPYEQALDLKELGFDEPCLMYYDYSLSLVESGVYECKAPLYQQCWRWFREKYDLDSYMITFSRNEVWFQINTLNGINKSCPCKFNDKHQIIEHTREEAELECLVKLIEIVKEKK